MSALRFAWASRLGCRAPFLDQFRTRTVHKCLASSLRGTGRMAMSTAPASDAHVQFNHGTMQFDEDLELALGSYIPKEALHVKWASWSTTPNLTDKPIVFVCPSMSHSAFVRDVPELREKGWWNHIVGCGDDFAIDLNEHNVVSASPLGSPYGSTSPLSVDPSTGEPWGATFPVITPEDMSSAIGRLLDGLDIPLVDAVVGASMGGMQALQFAAQHPSRFKKCIAIATTPATSPSAVAIRTNQRSAIINDTEFHNGNYAKLGSVGPVKGMMLARKMGILAYRSRKEFDNRFDWRYAVEDDSFEVQEYLDAQARKFVDGASSYDPNCYLVLSKAMDLMNLANPVRTLAPYAKQTGTRRAQLDIQHKLEEVLQNVPNDRKFLIISYSTDVLMAPSESEVLVEALQECGLFAKYKCLESDYGHDSFLLKSQKEPLHHLLTGFLQL